MAVRLQVPRKSRLVRFFLHPVGKVLLVLFLAVFAAGVAGFGYYYVKFARMIEQKLTEGPFPNTAMLFAAPQTISLGDEATTEEIVSLLRNSGYSESRTNRMGWYHVRPDAVEIFPGPDSYFDREAGVIRTSDNHVTQIISLRDNTERTQYLLEPELVTNLFDRKREKRRLVQFDDIPKLLVNAVVSVEDKRFFQHAGFDPLRIIKTVYVDLKERRKAEGASTISMQLARSLWLNLDKTWSRKASEVLITMHLEQKLSKQEIFEYYANQVDLGRRGSFAIRGFGEAAQAYFGKDIRDLTIPEAATLAGIIQRPSATNPIRWPDRARNRRNVVLKTMLDNGYINEREYAEAVASPLVVTKGGMESTDAPYFVDLVNDQLQDRLQGHDFQAKSYRVYTTIDMNLQREAAEAVRIGLQEVDEQLKRRKRRGKELPEAQVALVALDAATGEVKALVGGRNYGTSQLNRAEARRQPGSVFKPFVYAAGLSTALRGGTRILTPVSTVMDEPTTFWFDEKPYEPNNYKNEFHGLVTMRQALIKSMNIPTVKIAEMVGYDRVVELARDAGMNLNVQATPAVALGAYEVTPLEVAGAYTIFVDNGTHVKPSMIKYVRDDKGNVIYEHEPVKRQVLDPRVAYMMENLMEDVMLHGTGAGARSRGFTLPAAGKTGTSRDGWFAGFTSRLICVVWVGFDDNTELGLEGARSALPIWTEFMKRAHQYRAYRNVKPFEAPDGIVAVAIDPLSEQLASSSCPASRQEVFIAGTQPAEVCRLHGYRWGASQIAGWDTSAPATQGPAPSSTATIGAPPQPVAPEPPGRVVASKQPAIDAPPPPAQAQPPAKKKGFFGRIKDIFR